MLTSGFTNAPVSKVLILLVALTSLFVSVTDTKHLIYIQVVPHLWVYRQFWRLLTWQICYTNSTEVLFAVISLYNLREVERLWGPRKYASFLLSTLPYTTLLPPTLLALILRPLTFNELNYLPAGPTTILFAALAQYHAAIPHVYKYRIGTTRTPPSDPLSTSTPDSDRASWSSLSLTLTSKTLTYIYPLQLALSQLPGSAMGAAVGWAVGYAYRNDMLPYAAAWRVPAWVVGEKAKRPEGFEGLRRRLEGEGAGMGAASGVDGGREDREQRRRTLGRLIVEQFSSAGR